MFLLLFVLWIIFNSNITVEIVLFGIAFSALIYLFSCKFFDYSIKKDILLVKRVGYLIQYIVVLVVLIFKANIDTIKLIVSNRYDIEPTLVTFDLHFESDVAKVLFANSITLTPGTITAEVEGDTYKVHALDISFVEGINEGKIVDILRRMEACHE